MKKPGAKALDQHLDEELMSLLENRRFCYVIPIDGKVDGHGYRVSIAIEHAPGHRPTGDLDTLSDDKATRNAAFARGGSVPWFWGNTYDEAERICEAANAKLGYSPLEAAKIVASTMGMPEAPRVRTRRVRGRK